MIGGVDKAEFCGDLPDIGKVRGLNSCIGYCTTRRNNRYYVLESKPKKIVYTAVPNRFGESRSFIKCADWYMNIGTIALMVV